MKVTRIFLVRSKLLKLLALSTLFITSCGKSEMKVETPKDRIPGFELSKLSGVYVEQFAFDIMKRGELLRLKHKAHEVITDDLLVEFCHDLKSQTDFRGQRIQAGFWRFTNRKSFEICDSLTPSTCTSKGTVKGNTLNYQTGEVSHKAVTAQFEVARGNIYLGKATVDGEPAFFPRGTDVLMRFNEQMSTWLELFPKLAIRCL